MNNVISNLPLKCSVAQAALYDVYDPEIGLNVVDLGLIYQIDFDEAEKKVVCTMTLTTQFCPMGASIKTSVENALAQTFPGYEINVSLTFDPPWNYSLISEAGRAFLGK